MFWKLVLDLPKTLLFNFYYLPVRDAIKLPFHVDYRTRIQSLGNQVLAGIGQLSWQKNIM